MFKIDFGCGNAKKEGYIGVDIIKLDNVDIVHNLEKFPYPFENDSVDEIWMDNVLEHLKSPLVVIEELWRISKPGAKITISVPYFRSFYSVIDPTHVNYFGVNWFNYFNVHHEFWLKYRYTNASFEITSIKFDREWIESKKAKFFHKLLIKFAEKYPLKYEKNISHLVPLNSLTFNLIVHKD